MKLEDVVTMHGPIVLACELARWVASTKFQNPASGRENLGNLPESR